MDDGLRKQYENVMEMVEDARSKCLDGNGHIVPLMKNKHGRTVPNPYLDAYCKLLKQAQALARDLGIDAPAYDTNASSLAKATRSGDVEKQLEELSIQLAEEIERTTGHGKAALCRVFLDAQRELRQVRGEATPVDRIAEIQRRTGNANARRLSVI